MKSIPQNLLVVIGCIVVALVILAVFSVYSIKVPDKTVVLLSSGSFVEEGCTVKK